MTTPSKFSEIQTVAAYLDSMIGPEFRDNVIMPALCHTVDLGHGDSKSTKLRVKGGFTASQPTEAADATLSNYTETSPGTLSATHTKVYAEISYDVAEFTPVNPEELLQSASDAISTFVDESVLALATSFTSNVVGTAATANSAETLSEAIYKLDASKAKGPRAYILNPRAVQDVRSDLITSGVGNSNVFNSPQMLTIMSGLEPQANGMTGIYFDVPVFSTNATADTTVGYDDAWVGMCVAVQHALALGFAKAISFDVDKDIKKSVWQLAADLWFDTKIYRETAGCKILSVKG